VPSGFGLAFEKRMRKMIEAEIEELVRRKEARRKAKKSPRTE
jgi:hypothetical protein